MMKIRDIAVMCVEIGTDGVRGTFHSFVKNTTSLSASAESPRKNCLEGEFRCITWNEIARKSALELSVIVQSLAGCLCSSLTGTLGFWVHRSLCSTPQPAAGDSDQTFDTVRTAGFADSDLESQYLMRIWRRMTSIFTHLPLTDAFHFYFCFSSFF